MSRTNVKTFVVLILASFLIGCATPYGSSKGNFLGGFSETQIGEDAFTITFKGNAFISRETVANYTLLRSAEVVLAHGFSYFVIVDSDKYSKSGSYTTPVTSSTTATISGNTISGSTQYYGGDTFFYKKPRASNTIVCFRSKPDLGGLIYDANFLVRSLKSKYSITN